jgi:tetratricopeptide (TPR) repeat protein
LREVGRLEDAEAAGREALRLDAKNRQAHFNLAKVLFAKGDPAGALRGYREALAIKQDSAEVWVNLGLCLSNLDDLDGAIEAWETALHHDPDCAPAAANLGDALRIKGDLPRAELVLRHSLQVRPDRPHVLYTLCMVLLQQWKDEEAITLLRRAREIATREPIGADVASGLALCERRLLVAFGEGGELVPTDASTRRQLAARAAAAHRAGHPDHAVAIWRRALAGIELDPPLDAVKALAQAARSALIANSTAEPAGQAMEWQAIALAWLEQALDRAAAAVDAVPESAPRLRDAIAIVGDGPELAAVRRADGEGRWNSLWTKLELLLGRRQ